jgi:trehalose-6-phosphate synthase
MSDLVIVSNRGCFSFSETLLEEAQRCLAEGKKPRPPKFGAGGLERRDYTKGLTERGAIFQQALDKIRANGGDALFFQVTAPSRMDNPDYQYLSDTLSAELSHLTTSWRAGPSCT